MRVIARGTLRDFWKLSGRNDAEAPLEAWYAEATAATWANWAQVKAAYPTADWVGNGRAVFDIKKNKYRLVVKFEFEKQRIYIRFVGTHEEYDKIEDIKVI